jgi:YbbR domain-containing protein
MSLPPAATIARLVVAVILGAATWMVVTWQQNPFREEWLPVAVPIEATRLPSGLVQVGKPGDVRIRLRASQEAWGRIKPDEFKASVDLSRQGAGLHSLDVKVETSRDYQIVDWDPKRVTVRLEPLLQTTVPVQLRMTGRLADGYVVRAQSVTPDQLTITGEQDLAQSVTQAAVSVSLDGVRGDVTENATPTLLDERGQAISGVQFSPTTVRVSLAVDRQIAVKTVPVRVTTKGQVATGYSLAGLAVNPQTVTITGGPTALGQVDYVEVPPLDIAGARADLSRTTKLTAGPGYSLTDDVEVEVKALVQPLRTTEVLPVGVAVQGVAPGLEAKLAPSTVEVTVSGLVPALSALKPGDISAVVNASGLGPGTQTLPVRLNAPGSVSLDATNPAAVSITLSPPPSPTAVASPSPSASASAAPSPGASAGASPSPSAGGR